MNPISLRGGKSRAPARLLFKLETRWKWKFELHFIRISSMKYQTCSLQFKSSSSSILINSVLKERPFVYLFFKQGVQVFFYLKLLYWLDFQQFPEVGITSRSNSAKDWIRLLSGKQLTTHTDSFPNEIAVLSNWTLLSEEKLRRPFHQRYKWFYRIVFTCPGGHGTKDSGSVR